MKNRWEILVKAGDKLAFLRLYEEVDKISIGDVSCHDNGTGFWMIIYPSTEFKVLAKLRFDLVELPTWGVEVNFSDC